MLFGLSTACLYPQVTEKTFEYFCKNSVEAVEVFLNTFSEMDPKYLKDLRRLGDEYGTKVVSIHPFTCAFEPFMMFTDYARRFEDFLELYKPYFEACNLLGCDVFVFHGDRKEGFSTPERYMERYARLYETGRQYGVYAAQENVARCKSHSTGFIREMKRYLGGNVRFVLDTKQVIRSGENLYEMVDAMGDSVIHIHLSDCTAEKDCLPVGKGGLDINRLLNALKTNGFDRSVIIELYRENFEDSDELLLSLKKLKLFGNML